MIKLPPVKVGMALNEIDTPALLIDLDAFERNLDRMARLLSPHRARLRAHAKTHKCPTIALHQIARGAVGVCCQKVSEAEAMIDGGVGDVLVSNEIVGKEKLARLTALAKKANIAVCADNADNVTDLANAAEKAGIQLSVLVEIDIGAGRCGISPGQPAVELAKQINGRDSLRFVGLQAYHGAAQHIYECNQRMQAIEKSSTLTQHTVELLRSAGLQCEWVTGAGTGTFEFEMANGVYTEIQAGSYIFMDADYRKVQGAPQQFEPSLFVLTTVMSKPTTDRAICDAGLKSHSVDSGLPKVFKRPDLDYVLATDEHGTIRLNDRSHAPRIGDQLWLVPGHCDPTVNLHDRFIGIRAGRVEAIWPIAARGAIY